ncbi:MAG: SCO family protein [Desulfuromonadales bacterium]|nr:SCO family protein [Desulfuromonadales bacterium]
MTALLATLWLPLPARSAEHQHTASDHQQHVAPPLKPSAQAEHVHPAPAAAATGVGLDEQLGARIPLDLMFRDENGNPVRLGDLITRPTVIAPVYYRCPNVCHFLQGELAQTLPQIKLTAGTDYTVLSISFDETETPELARRTRDTYLTAAGGKIPPAGWRFLTGDLAEIMKLTGAAGYRFQRVGSEFQHPVVIFVVTPDGTIVRYLHGTRVLPKDLALALMEAREGHVGTTIRKMVQYCFSYDPEQKTYVFNLLRVAATVILVTLCLFLAWLLFSGKRKKTKDPHS